MHLLSHMRFYLSVPSGVEDWADFNAAACAVLVGALRCAGGLPEQRQGRRRREGGGRTGKEWADFSALRAFQRANWDPRGALRTWQAGRRQVAAARGAVVCSLGGRDVQQ